MCVGFNVKLHLIRPYGFIFDPKRYDKDFIRASANHLDQLMFAEYDDFNDFLNVNKPNQDQLYFYTRYGTKTLMILIIKTTSKWCLFNIW